MEIIELNAGDMNVSKPALDEYDFSEVIPWENPEDMTKPWIANPHFIPSVLVYALCLIFGTAGNALVMWAMQCGRNKSVTGIFLISLAVADLLLLLSAPFDVASHYVKNNTGGNVTCKMVGYARKLSAFAAVFNLIAITFERYIVIVHPMRARQHVTMKNCLRTLVLVWILAIVMAVPSMLTWEVQSYYYGKFNEEYRLIPGSVVKVLHCEETPLMDEAFNVFYYFTFLFILPLGIHSVCYSRMIYVLWSSTSSETVLRSHTGNAPRIVVTGASKSVSGATDQQEELVADSEHRKTPEEDPLSPRNGSSTAFLTGANQVPEIRRNRPGSLAFFELPNLSRKPLSRFQRAKNQFNSWKQRKQNTSNKPRRGLSLHSSNKGMDLKAGRRQVIKMLLMITMAFMLCWGPLVVFEVLRYHEMMPFQNATFAAKLIVNLLPYFHCCLNPIIFGFMSRNFRKSFKKACCSSEDPEKRTTTRSITVRTASPEITISHMISASPLRIRKNDGRFLGSKT